MTIKLGSGKHTETLHVLLSRIYSVAPLLQTDTVEHKKHSMAAILFYILKKSGFPKNILKHSTVRFFIAVLNTAAFTGNPSGCRLSIR
jgi:surface polysaccharide O-acyltransferase-like enzyme